MTCINTIKKMASILFPEIKEPLTKILQKLNSNKELLNRLAHLRNLTVENLEAMAGDHIFDDYPELFDITKQEGLEIRAYFSDPENMLGISVLRLHQEFQHLERERKEYIDSINNHRRYKSLEHINYM